ncbi:hypothetical protein PC118_g11649 [Phytophthora cactorum]|uniref:Uncharacterized protein n=1 Tax=Phytophthora cactorum TaxID=29920 RepID=A0A8T1FW90_9STRA|nr:hypothetical protein PC112_g5020 [Phytophthora cactorum]KAG2867827.1 hypothetical protein PC113_g1627 [Phytophthora cactorum]KAG2901850.1 hypothetical protein PC114_g12978 [Phytophthora cactorum]KAG2935946.1 hypothetical protein PC115_g4749 [Phytophthora cactorum]KAG2979634.1 hypothetical protein PC118_g11649 [Phytophthora cactorum]
MVATAGKVPPGRTPKSTRNSKIHQELLATLSQRHLRKLRRNNELPAATTAEAKGTNNTAATRPKKRASKHQVKLTTPDMEVLESKRSVEPPNSREASAEPKDRVFSVETARGEVLATEATVDTAMATADMVTTERPKATEAAADTTMETVESTMATEATVDTTVESDPAADTTMKTESAVSTALTSIVGEAVADMCWKEKADIDVKTAKESPRTSSGRRCSQCQRVDSDANMMTEGADRCTALNSEEDSDGCDEPEHDDDSDGSADWVCEWDIGDLSDEKLEEAPEEIPNSIWPSAAKDAKMLTAMRHSDPSKFGPDPTYAGLYDGPYGPSDSVLDVADDPLVLLFYFMPPQLWRQIAIESNTYHTQSITKRARAIRA